MDPSIRTGTIGTTHAVDACGTIDAIPPQRRDFPATT
jgi:hypothetical protein